MSITVGSVGDIIALIQLAASVKTCLGASRGSSADFQDVVGLMDSLEETLLATQKMLEGIDESPRAPGSLDTLEQRRLVLAQIHRCKTCISDYMKQIQKYGKSLGKGGSKNALSDIFRKLQWGTNEKGTMERFRQDVQMRLELLNLQSANLSRTVEKHRHNIVQTTFQQASEERRHIASTTESHLVGIEMRLDCVMPAWTNNNRFGDSVFANNCGFPALPMDQFWIWKPVIVRDPIGTQWPFPIGLISSWGAMHHAYTNLFENAYGILDRAYRREYHLWNVRLRQPINDSKDFDWCFQAGERLDLAITVVATMATMDVDLCGRLVNMMPSLGQPHRFDQLDGDRYRALVERRALRRERISPGSALLRIYPSYNRNVPYTLIEIRSGDSVSPSNIFRFHQSGLTKIYWDMELPLQIVYSLSPEVSGDLVVISSFLRFPPSGRMWPESLWQDAWWRVT